MKIIRPFSRHIRALHIQFKSLLFIKPTSYLICDPPTACSSLLVKHEDGAREQQHLHLREKKQKGSTENEIQFEVGKVYTRRLLMSVESAAFNSLTNRARQGMRCRCCWRGTREAAASRVWVGVSAKREKKLIKSSLKRFSLASSFARCPPV